MNLTSKLILHLDDDRFLQPVPAVQGDTARSVEVVLYAGGQPWDIPPEATASIRYRWQDGAGGKYDTLSDGSKAWSFSGNTVTIALDAAVLGVPGTTTMQIALHSGEEVLSTFSFQAQVQADPSRGTSAPGVPSQGGTGSMELQPLTFTGAVAATYDGTKPVRVNIPTGGSNYPLPVATADKLGGVQPVAKSADMTQSVGVDATGRLWTVPSAGGSNEWRLAKEVTLEETVKAITISEDDDGNPLNASEIFYEWHNPSSTESKSLMYVTIYNADGSACARVVCGEVNQQSLETFTTVRMSRLGNAVYVSSVTSKAAHQAGTCSAVPVAVENDRITKILIATDGRMQMYAGATLKLYVRG